MKLKYSVEVKEDYQVMDNSSISKSCELPDIFEKQKMQRRENQISTFANEESKDVSKTTRRRPRL